MFICFLILLQFSLVPSLLILEPRTCVNSTLTVYGFPKCNSTGGLLGTPYSHYRSEVLTLVTTPKGNLLGPDVALYEQFTVNHTTPFANGYDCSKTGFHDKFCVDVCVFGLSNNRTTPPIYCLGDAAYCDAYNCSDDVTTYVCNCTGYKISEHTQYAFKGIYYNATAFNTVTKYYDLEPLVRPLFRTAHNVYASLEDNVLTITMDAVAKYTVVVKKEEEKYTDVFSFDSNIGVFTLPTAALLKTGVLSVTVFDADGQLGTATVYVIGFSSCILHDCIFCTAAFKNFSCLPFTWKISFVFFFSIICLLICLTFPLIALISTSVLKCFGYSWVKVFKTCSFCLRKCCYPVISKMKDINEKIESDPESYPLTNYEKSKLDAAYVEDLQKQNEEQALREAKIEQEFKDLQRRKTLLDESKLKRGKQTVVVPGVSGFKIEYLIMIVCCLIPSVLSCDSVFSIGSDTLTCDKTTCTILFSTEVSFAGENSTACFTLDDKNGNLVGVMNLTYNRFYHFYSVAHLYSTADYELHGANEYRCFQAGSCTTDKCKNLDSDVDRSAYGELFKDDAITWPGQTYCIRSGGGVSSSCFYEDEGCIFSAYGLVPGGNWMDVYKPITVESKLDYTLCYNFYGHESCSTSSISQDIDDFTLMTVEMISTFSGTVSFPDDFKFVVGVSGTALTTTSDVNAPKAGTIGEIQSNSKTNMYYPSGTSFIFDKDMVQYAKQSKSLNYITTPQGWDLFTSQEKFPLTYNGEIFTYLTSDVTEFFSIPIDQPLVTLGLTFNNSYVLTKNVSVTCPKILSVINATGCYQCSEGAILFLQAESTCQYGLVSVSMSNVDLLTTSVFLGQKAVFGLHFSSDIQSQKVLIKLFSSGGSDSISFTYKLVEKNDVRNDTGGNVIHEKSKKHAGIWGSISWFFSHTITNFFESFIKGIEKWWYWVILIVIFLLILLCIFCLAKPCMELMICCFNMSGLKKFRKGAKYINYSEVPLGENSKEKVGKIM